MWTISGVKIVGRYWVLEKEFPATVYAGLFIDALTHDPTNPGPKLGSERQILEDPIVGVIGEWESPQGEWGGHTRGIQVFTRLLNRVFVADPYGPVPEPAQASERGGMIALGPFAHALVVTVRDEPGPQFRDFIIVQADEVAGDGAAGEAGQKHFARIAAV